ncbi:MAG: DUF1150 family protein [Magnetovibrio sp.]|nr:DUF1150 family protein [Magnetovibrio sp.]
MTDITRPTNANPRLTATAGQSFAELGLADIAYIKPTVLDGTVVFAVHAANGDQLAIAPTRDIAAALVVQNDLAPVYVN